MSETPIGRCSECSGTVVKETGAYWSTVPPKARCLQCGATEAPPDKVIPMQKPASLPSLQQYKDQLQGYKDQFRRALDLEDAIAKERFLPTPPTQLGCGVCGRVGCLVYHGPSYGQHTGTGVPTTTF